jgi:Holliday junction resolvasome RuvABC endonuclease subunit
MRKKNTERILAIDPGTRNIGFALLDKGQLVHYGVKTIRQMNSPHEKLREGRKIVLRLINDFRPEILVVEKTFFANNRNSVLLNVFADEIKAVGKRKDLRVQGLAANSVRKLICGNGRASKDEVAREVVSRYPELKPYLTSDRRWKERYHRNMFDAVALGLAENMRRAG